MWGSCFWLCTSVRLLLLIPSPPPPTHTQLTHTQLAHTQLNLLTQLTHTTYPHTTQLTHTTCPHTSTLWALRPHDSIHSSRDVLDGCDIGIDMATESKPGENEIKNETKTRCKRDPGPGRSKLPPGKSNRKVEAHQESSTSPAAG